MNEKIFFSFTGADMHGVTAGNGCANRLIAHPDKILISGVQFSENSKPHNDPFDKILICQAKSEVLRFMPHDSLIPDYNEECVLYV